MESGLTPAQLWIMMLCSSSSLQKLKVKSYVVSPPFDTVSFSVGESVCVCVFLSLDSWNVLSIKLKNNKSCV